VFAETHTAAFGRRVAVCIKQEILTRFTRGFYVASDFALPVLSQRIAPSSCVSFENILAQNLVVGSNPAKRLTAIKVGPTRRYEALGFEIVHLGVQPSLIFGFEVIDGVKTANSEKAVLDVLYFHLRGRRCTFDIYSDINLRKLDMNLIRDYLGRYRNPKFVAFAKNVLRIS